MNSDACIYKEWDYVNLVTEIFAAVEIGVSGLFNRQLSLRGAYPRSDIFDWLIRFCVMLASLFKVL